MPVASRLVMRWIVVAVAVATLLGTTPLAVDSKSGPSKVDPALLAAAKADPNGLFQVIVRGAATSGVRNENGTDRLKKAEATFAGPRSGERRSLAIVGGASGTLRGSDVIALAKDARVDRAVRNDSLAMEWSGTDAAATAAQPGILEVNAPAAWSALGVSGKGVGVAVIDSGVADHPDLAGRIIARVDLTGEQSNGDPGGHGTHVAGLIAGDGSASGGMWTGTAPQADIVSVRVIDATGHARLSTIFAGMQWVLRNRTTYHIKVVNMSFGGTALSGYQSDLLASAAEMLYFAGLTVVVSAGNAGSAASTITTPGTDPFVLTVGAADDNGTPVLADDNVAIWSSRGPTAFDGIAKPDLIAPGRKMIGLRSAGSTLDLAYPDRRVLAPGATDAQYFSMSGTSMAAPVVAGVAALYLERNPGAQPLAVKQQLTGTAAALPLVSRADQGAGIVDALAALTAPQVHGAYTRYPASTAFAQTVFQKLYGQPIVWRDPAFNGGVDSRGIPWGDVTWEDITWDDITWEDITWEAFNWLDITWADVTWEDITWEMAK